MKTRFRLKKYRWYIVDLTNPHKPEILRKHFEEKQQVERFIEKYLEGRFKPIYWKKAEEYGLKDMPMYTKRKSKLPPKPKYDYPPDCVTPYQKELYRQVVRKKRKQMKRAPKVTETAVWEILDDKPMRFIRRVRLYSKNHWVFSSPVSNFKDLKKIYPWPKELRHLCNITRTLLKFYDIGDYQPHQVALFIYKKWGAKIRKHCDKPLNCIPDDQERVIKELKARGFVPEDQVPFDLVYDSYICTKDGVKPRLVHPQQCWHSFDESKLYDMSVFDFQVRMGIPGWVKANQGGLERRK